MSMPRVNASLEQPSGDDIDVSGLSAAAREATALGVRLGWIGHNYGAASGTTGVILVSRVEPAVRVEFPPSRQMRAGAVEAAVRKLRRYAVPEALAREVAQEQERARSKERATRAREARRLAAVPPPEEPQVPVEPAVVEEVVVEEVDAEAVLAQIRELVGGGRVAELEARVAELERENADLAARLAAAEAKAEKWSTLAELVRGDVVDV